MVNSPNFRQTAVFFLQIHITGGQTMASPGARPETIEKLVGAVYPSFAMLAGVMF